MLLPALLLPALLVALGMAVGLTALTRGTRVQHARFEANPMVARVSGEVHAGEEQVLIHLARTLDVAPGRTDVGYGQIYIAGSAGTSLRLASRSEIGRGFDGEVRVRRARRGTTVEYFVLRLPGDETLHRRIRALDGEIAASLRGLDPAAQVRTATEATPRRRGGFTTSRAG